MRFRPMLSVPREWASTSSSSKAGFTRASHFRTISPRAMLLTAGSRWRLSNPSAKCAHMNLLGRQIGLDQPFFRTAGPCVVKNEDLQLRTAERLKQIADKLGIFLIFKSSFDKANRSSDKSYRGPGMEEGLRILGKVREAGGLPVLTDGHEIAQIEG